MRHLRSASAIVLRSFGTASPAARRTSLAPLRISHRGRLRAGVAAPHPKLTECNGGGKKKKRTDFLSGQPEAVGFA